MAQIFLSHSSKDAEVAELLKQRLEKQGYKVFLDFDEESGIKGGAYWEDSLYRGLSVCGVVIPLLSPDWLASKWCFAECVLARSSGKKIVPLRVAACDTSFVFRDVQHIDLVHDLEEGHRRVEIALQEVFPWDATRPPYPGLLAFQEQDAAIFFGRKYDIAKGVEKLEGLRRGGNTSPHFMLALGASGSGKSSLVRAGILPILRTRDEWLPLPPLRPHEDPIAELAASVASAYVVAGYPREYTEIRKQLEEAAFSKPVDGTALDSIARDLVIKSQNSDLTVLIVIDQAEELFGGSNVQQADLFLRLLRASLEGSDSRLMALATMRSEFLGAFQSHRFLLDSTYPGSFGYREFTIDPLPVNRFSEIIREPAKRTGIDIKAEVVQRMVDETGTHDALPLLAYTLRQLWEAYRTTGHFELKDYEALGGLEGSIRKAADDALRPSDLQANQLEALHAAFVPALVWVGPDGARVKRQAYRDKLPRDAAKLLQRFVEARLLITNSDRDGRETIELAHEALMRVWPQLDTWLEQDQDKLRLLESVLGAAREWQNENRNPDLLVHRSDRLADAIALVREPRFAEHGMPASEYLSNCGSAEKLREQAERDEHDRQIRDAEQIAEGRRIAARRTVVGMLVALILAMGASIAGWEAWTNSQEAKSQQLVAEEQRKKAEAARKLSDDKAEEARQAARKALLSQSRYLANRSQELLNKGQMETAVLLALEALPKDNEDLEDRPYTPEAEAVLYKALAAPLGIHKIKSLSGGHRAFATFSPDGSRFVTAKGDSARVWDTISGRQIAVFKDQKNEFLQAEFSPDGKRIVTASLDGTAQIWDVDNGKPLQVLKGHQESVLNATFSSSGQFVVTASWDATARLWNASTGKTVVAFTGHTEFICCVKINRVETRVVTVSEDGTARLWDAKTGKQLAVFENIPRRLSDPMSESVPILFSPNNDHVLTIHTDHTIRLWKASNGKEVKRFKGHTGDVVWAAFSKDGRRLFTTASDETARIWDVAQDSKTRPPNPGGVVLDEALRIIIPSQEWGLPPYRFGIGPKFALSPDERYMAIYDRAGNLGFWDTTTGRRLGKSIRATGRSGYPSDIVATAMDDRLLTVDGGDVTLWAIDSGVRSRDLHYPGKLTTLAVSPNGDQLLTASRRGHIQLWDWRQDKQRVLLEKYKARITSADFSPDDQLAVAGFDDGTAMLWRTDEAELIAVLKGHQDAIRAVRFAPDGKFVVTASNDHTLRTWDLYGKELDVYRGHQAPVSKFVISANGSRLASASNDGMVRLWRLDDAVKVSIGKTIEGNGTPIYALALRGDGKRLLTSASGRTWSNVGNSSATLWSTEPLERLAELSGHLGSVTEAAFTLDGSRVMTAELFGGHQIWKSEDGAWLHQSRQGTHGSVLMAAAYSPDGSRIVSVDDSGRIRATDSESGTNLITLHSNPVTRTLDPNQYRSPKPYPLVDYAVISKDGRVVVSGDQDGEIHVRELLPDTRSTIEAARQHVPGSLTEAQRRYFFLSDE